MPTIEGYIISSFESGAVIDNVDFRHFFIRNNECEICIVVKPDCRDFQTCINELNYKSHNNKWQSFKNCVAISGGCGYMI